MKRYAFAAGAAALSLLLAACSSSSESDGTAPGSGGIVISGFAYSGTLSVKTGQKVSVTNDDTTEHTVTDQKTNLFDTGTIEVRGGTGQFIAPAKAGTYPFGCRFHPTMKGTLSVTG